MKNIALMSLVTLLVSCNGSGGGSHPTGQGPASSESASAFTTDHYEKYLRSLKPGMNSESVTTEPYYFVNEEGKIELKIIRTISKDTILKVEGDLLYSLEEIDSEGEQTKLVHIRSMNKMIRQNKERMSYSVSGNTVSGSFRSSDAYTLYGSNYEEIEIVEKQLFTKTFTLANYECPARTIGKYTTTATIDGKPVKLPSAEFVSERSCGEVIRREDLKNIDLTQVYECDATESDEDEKDCSEDPLDMSDLFN